ncbi:MAG: hydroxyectoine utilization dehydratase EutB [Geminicoccaceae bacterium]
MIDQITLADIYAARRRLGNHVRRTPINPSPSLTEHLGVPVHLKLEHHQITGSFKLRGATNAVLALTEEEKAGGVVGVSTGNYGRGLAFACKQAGVPCIICMSELVPANKVESIKALGAEVRIVGCSQDDAQIEVNRLVGDQGMVMLPPFDHPDIIAGQGTLGLELIEDIPDLETVLVPLSGGGLISGVALAIKTARPSAKIVAVTMERGAAMHASLDAGKPVMVEEMESLADALGGGIGLDNRYTFAMCQDLVDDSLLVTEDEIAAGIRHAYAQEKQVIEGSGAVGIAAILAGKVQPGSTTLVITSGANIDMALHARLIATSKDGDSLA